MTEPTPKWFPIPDHVAQVLGRLAFYAAWLDDTLSEAVIVGNANATADGESTPGWAESGSQLVAAVLAIDPSQQVLKDLTDHLTDMNDVRNQLIHGVWLWQDEKALILRRARGKGPRQIRYATYTYEQIEQLIDKYQHLGTIAEKLVEILLKGNPAARALRDEQSPKCSIDGSTMEDFYTSEVIVWKCPLCGAVQPA